eukprot:PhM_4_TR15213/c3_g1_i1/m.1732
MTTQETLVKEAFEAEGPSRRCQRRWISRRCTSAVLAPRPTIVGADVNAHNIWWDDLIPEETRRHQSPPPRAPAKGKQSGGKGRVDLGVEEKRAAAQLAHIEKMPEEAKMALREMDDIAEKLEERAEAIICLSRAARLGAWESARSAKKM